MEKHVIIYLFIYFKTVFVGGGRSMKTRSYLKQRWRLMFNCYLQKNLRTEMKADT